MARALTKADRIEQTRQSLELCRVAPYEQLDYALQALKNGANQRMAAKAAGIPFGTFQLMIELGKDGHPVWADVYVAIERADWIGAEGAQKRLQEKAEDGDMQSYKELMKQKMPEEFGPVYEPRESPDGAGLTIAPGLNVQIAQFSPAPEPAQLEEGEVIEAEQVERDGDAK